MFRVQICEDTHLEPLHERHAGEIFARVDEDRDYLRQWLPWVDATRTADDTLSFIRSSLEKFAANKTITAAIWHRNRFAGVAGTHDIDWLNRKVELGYWIGSEFQGRGIVTDTCRALVTYLFAELDLHRVEIHCAVENTRSAAIPRRLGFTLEGTAREATRLGTRYHDSLRFAMLKRDWKAS